MEKVVEQQADNFLIKFLFFQQVDGAETRYKEEKYEYTKDMNNKVNECNIGVRDAGTSHDSDKESIQG